MSERADALVCVVHALENASTLEVVDNHLLVLATLAVEDEFSNTSFFSTDFNTLIDIAIGVTSNRNRLFPSRNIGLNTLYYYGCTENGSVHYRPDSTVRALIHFTKVIFLNSGIIRCDSRALNGNSKSVCSICRVDSYLIAGLITMFKSKIVILCLQIDKRIQQFVLYHLPDNTGHLISIHLYQRCCHLNFSQNIPSSESHIYCFAKIAGWPILLRHHAIFFFLFPFCSVSYSITFLSAFIMCS